MNVSTSNNIFTQSNTTHLNQSAKVSTANTQVQKNQEENTNGGISKDGDTVTISAQGTYLQKTFSGSLSKDTVESLTEESDTNIGSTAQITAKAAASAGISEANTNNQIKSGNAEATSSSTSESTSNLSQYTETELKQMLEDGEITRQEYNEEIESRQQSSSDDSSEETTDNESDITTA